ncbi:hypothetical protein STEG23_004596, partial [Scotinomys teguina]
AISIPACRSPIIHGADISTGAVWVSALMMSENSRFQTTREPLWSDQIQGLTPSPGH